MIYRTPYFVASALLVAILPFTGGCSLLQASFVALAVIHDRAIGDKAIREKNGDFVLAGTISDESGMPIEQLAFEAEAWQQCFWPDDSPMCGGGVIPDRARSGSVFRVELKQYQSARLVFYKPGYETQAIIYALEGHEFPPGLCEPRPPAVVTQLSGPKKFEKTDIRVVMRRLGPDEKQSDAEGPGFLREGPLILRPGEGDRLRPATRPTTDPSRTAAE